MRFYQLGDTGVQSWISGWSDEVYSQCEGMVRGDTQVPPRLEINIAGGERLPDLLGAGMLTALSPRMASTLHALAATGYTLVPLMLRHPALGISIDGYSALIVHGRGGPLDEDRMQPIKRSGNAILSCQGFYIYENRWDGSDIFCIDGLGVSIWVTERVAEALEKVRPRLRNVVLRPNTQMRPDVPESAKKDIARAGRRQRPQNATEA